LTSQFETGLSQNAFENRFSVFHPEIRYPNWNYCSPSAQIFQRSFPVSGREIVLLNRKPCFYFIMASELPFSTTVVPFYLQSFDSKRLVKVILQKPTRNNTKPQTIKDV
jgi:hypothetical protein